jgi:acetyl esterase/lipase
MKTSILFLVYLFFVLGINAQEIISLPHESPAHVQWVGEEKAFFSNIWNTEVVCNVSTPTMEVFRPVAASANGTAVVIAPGGGLYALSIESEGNMVARWLNEKGITAFVLRYRLVPTGVDGVQELNETSSNNLDEFKKMISAVMPYSVADGLTAVQYVRENASALGVDQNKIGFMGFSAGGAVTQGVAYNAAGANRPDFIVPVYSWTSAMPVQKAPENTPLMLVICASDDPLGLASGSIELYNSWLVAGKTAELHMYSKGGHGFGMKKQDLPSDSWIERFYNWGIAEKIIIPTK